MRSFDDVLPSIPLDEAAEYFLNLKYAHAHQPTEEQVVEAFKGLSKQAQAEVLAEAGITKEALGSGFGAGKTTREKTAAMEPTLDEYLAQEQEGMSAQKEVERQYLGQRVQDMGSELQMGQQSAGEQSAMMQQMQQQLEQSNQQIQMAQQTAAMAQQQALQAQQQQLAKADESLRTQQMAAQMRTAYQELRGQLMNLATNDPAMSIGNELKGQPTEMGPDGMGAPPMGPPGMEGQPGAEAGPEATPPPGGAGGAPPQMGPGEEAPAKVAAAPHMGHLLGGAAGAGAGSLLAQREVESGPERHKATLAKLQGEPGAGGFLNALQQAKAKAMLAFSETAREHPTAANLAGTAIGGAMGVGAGDAVKGLMTTPKY